MLDPNNSIKEESIKKESSELDLKIKNSYAKDDLCNE